jgi:CRP-like cAMP-binding protein
MAQLPEFVQNKIYCEFLFSSFLSNFRETFKIMKNVNGRESQMTWEDSSYREFMLAILSHLEPRFEKKGTVLFEELQEISEVIFIGKGTIDIGYEINRQRRFVMRYTNKIVMGAYNCTFNKRAIFIYRCKTDCEGYFIRKENWVNLVTMDPEIERFIKKNVTIDYEHNIKFKVLKVKEVHI